MKVGMLMDNPNSWYAPYADVLARKIEERGHILSRVAKAEDLTESDVVFLLSCERVIPAALLKRHKHSLVIHASEVPKGRGWSPMTWQVLEGKNEIVVSLFEATEPVDSGAVYDREVVQFEGHELIDELRAKEAAAIQKLALRFLDAYPSVKGAVQTGEPTSYRRRTPKDSELDPEKTLAEQFNLLRVVDNDRYPAHFTIRGHEYVLKIEKRS